MAKTLRGGQTPRTARQHRMSYVAFEPTELAKLTKPQLLEMADDLGVAVSAKDKKADIVAAIEKAKS